MQKKRAQATVDFIKYIQPLGFTITPASYLAWDGNCYFSGLLFFMRQWGIAENWTVKSLRRAVFNYISDLPIDDPEFVNDFYESYINFDALDNEDLRRSSFIADCAKLAETSCYKLEHSTIGEMAALGICRKFNVCIRMFKPNDAKNPDDIIGDPNAKYQMVMGYFDVDDCQHVQALVPYDPNL